MNKYLAELGITDEHCCSLSEQDYCDLDYFLSLEIYPKLCHFRDVCIGDEYPSVLSSKEEWITIVNKMTEAFKLILLDSDDSNKIDEGLNLFAKYFRCLWH